jgi:hypothetical protein
VLLKAKRTNNKQKEKGHHYVYEWMHIKCVQGQKEHTTSKNKKETTMCMSGCISSVIKGKKEAWMGAY